MCYVESKCPLNYSCAADTERPYVLSKYTILSAISCSLRSEMIFLFSFKLKSIFENLLFLKFIFFWSKVLLFLLFFSVIKFENRN